MATWALSESVTNNRALVIAGYFYGLNTMFLTLRAFGHLMEATKGIGAIQIALFHIIGDVITIFWQFIAAILAFSMAVAKVFMAEKSYVTSHSVGKDLWVENILLIMYFDSWLVQFQYNVNVTLSIVVIGFSNFGAVQSQSLWR